MATIQNDRDVLLQAASPRVIPHTIPIDQIEGLEDALKRLRINASATSFVGTSGATTPATIVLTAERQNGLAGPVVWSILTGSGTVAPAGDVCTVTGSTVTGQSITLRARVTENATNYDAQITLTKFGTLAGQGAVNLATQITGQLANGNVSGLGALALLGSVSLTNPAQVVGDLAANRIGVGTLAAGVVYAGTVNVDNLVGTTITGKNISSANLIYVGGGTSLGPMVFLGSGGSGPGPYPYTGDARINGYFNSVYSASGGFIENGASGIVLRNPGTGGIKIGLPNPYVGAVTITANPMKLVCGNFQIDASGLTGTMGARILLKNVVYNVSVGGGPTQTVEFL